MPDRTIRVPHRPPRRNRPLAPVLAAARVVAAPSAAESPLDPQRLAINPVEQVAELSAGQRAGLCAARARPVSTRVLQQIAEAGPGAFSAARAHAGRSRRGRGRRNLLPRDPCGGGLRRRGHPSGADRQLRGRGLPAAPKAGPDGSVHRPRQLRRGRALRPRGLRRCADAPGGEGLRPVPAGGRGAPANLTAARAAPDRAAGGDPGRHRLRLRARPGRLPGPDIMGIRGVPIPFAQGIVASPRAWVGVPAGRSRPRRWHGFVHRW